MTVNCMTVNCMTVNQDCETRMLPACNRPRCWPMLLSVQLPCSHNSYHTMSAISSFVTIDLLESIASSIEVPKLSSEAARALAPDVEYKLRELIQVGWTATASAHASLSGGHA